VADWDALLAWAEEQAAAQEERRRDAAAAATAAAEAVASTLDDLGRSCADCDIDIGDGDDVGQAAAAAHATAQREVQQISAAIEEAAELRTRAGSLQTEADVARDLALHLSASPARFESWIVNEALRRLVLGATTILNELSNDQYSLTVDETGSFLVVDRHNADETRSARTLSGGETFLASLALALALADQLTELASAGSARLEAIFLDEGFGTLDPETLDTVAATVENLAASGRMVGIITHVRELAERVPTQFRVRKQSRTSTIEKVVA